MFDMSVSEPLCFLRQLRCGAKHFILLDYGRRRQISYHRGMRAIDIIRRKRDGGKLMLYRYIGILGLALILTIATTFSTALGSIGIQIGGISGIAPSRKGDLARLGLRALLGGSLATFMTATNPGLLSW